MDLTIIVVPSAVFLSVTLLAVTISNMNRSSRLLRQRVQRYGPQVTNAATASSDAGIMRDQRLSSLNSLDLLLRHIGHAEGMTLSLARAGLPLRVGEYLLMRLLFALILTLFPLVAGLPLPLVSLFGLVGFLLPKLYVKRRQQSRLKKINDQLVDMTTMIVNSLRSGYSFIQGLELVAREMPPPIAQEVSQVLREMSLGINTEEALTNLSKRVKSYDLDLIVTAMLIQRQVGSNLAEILENISNTIRARIRMLREIHSLTSEARLSGYIVGLLPFFLMAILSLVSRSYISDLLTNALGQILLGAALVLEAIGFVVMRRITAIEV